EEVIPSTREGEFAETLRWDLIGCRHVQALDIALTGVSGLRVDAKQSSVVRVADKPEIVVAPAIIGGIERSDYVIRDQYLGKGVSTQDKVCREDLIPICRHREARNKLRGPNDTGCIGVAFFGL